MLLKMKLNNMKIIQTALVLILTHSTDSKRDIANTNGHNEKPLTQESGSDRLGIAPYNYRVKEHRWPQRTIRSSKDTMSPHLLHRNQMAGEYRDTSRLASRVSVLHIHRALIRNKIREIVLVRSIHVQQQEV